jgi:hypothetical protein
MRLYTLYDVNNFNNWWSTFLNKQYVLQLNLHLLPPHDPHQERRSLLNHVHPHLHLHQELLQERPLFQLDLGLEAVDVAQSVAAAVAPLKIEFTQQLEESSPRR